MKDNTFKRAPHNPPHLFIPNAYYMLTASTYRKTPLISLPKRKQEWVEAFLHAAEIYNWQVVAWVILQNHYHAIVESPENVETLSKFVGSFHKYTARKWNDEDLSNGRKVWWNYWDTCIRSENDYYTRLEYIFWDPVKHGLVTTPEDYPFSNYKEFLVKWGIDLNFTNVDEVSNVPEF
jgi:putative transposase